MVDIAEVFVLSFVRLNSGSTCGEFFLHPEFELNIIILAEPRTSAASKLR
jgi:hypothetical protein